MVGGFNPFAGFGKQPAPKRKPKPKAPPPSVDRQITRAVRTVGTTTKRTAPVITRRMQRVVAAAPKVDPVIARGDQIAALASQPKRVSPEQQALRDKVRAAYVSEGVNPILTGRLADVSAAADPFITVTEKITRPFTTPQTVAGNLIAGRPVEALKNLGTLSYKGKYTTPSAELHKRGLLTGDSASSLLLGLGADVAPSFAIPGFKGADRAAGLKASRAVSIAQDLAGSTSRVTRETVAHADTAASIPKARPRQQRASALNPRSGPDIITNPRATTVPMRSVKGGAGSRGGRPVRATAVPRRGAADLPYRPKNVQNALDEFLATVNKYRDVTQRTHTTLQAARAGEKLGRAAQATATAERAMVRRIRQQPEAQGAQAALQPRTLPEARSSSVTPVAGGRGLPRLRSRVANATSDVQRLTARTPSMKKVGKTGQKLVKATERLKTVEKRMYNAIHAPERPTAAPSFRQEQKFTKNFTGSLARDWIQSNMEYAAAHSAASHEAPIGLNITAPWNRRGKGVTIPFTTRSLAKRIKGSFDSTIPVTSGDLIGRALQKTTKGLGDFHKAYRVWAVSRYGPHPVIRAGALAADDVVRMGESRSVHSIRAAQKRHGVRAGSKEDSLAAAWIEGTTHKPVPENVKAYARDLTRLTEQNASEFIRAGGKLKRFGTTGKLEGGLDSQYVMHLLPPEERAKFAVSGLARRHLYYGSKPSFLKRRDMLTIAELKRAGYHPEESLAKLTLYRASAHYRAMTDMELHRLIERQYGQHAAAAPANHELLPSQFTDSSTHVPPDISEAMRNVAEARAFMPKNKVTQSLQQANSWWKEWALFTSGHDVRNQFGDMLLGFQKTANPLAPLSNLGRGIKTITSKGKVGGKSRLTSAQAHRAAEVAGVREHGLLAGDVLQGVTPTKGPNVVGRTSLRRSDRAILRAVRKARTYREGSNRAGVFTNELRKGEGIVHAAQTSHDTLFHYGDVGKAVAWARKSPLGAPFATWLAKNLPHQFKLAVQNPAQLSAQLAALQSLYMQSGSPPRFLQQDYQRQSIGIPIPGKGWVNSLQPPINALNVLPASLTSGAIGDAGRGLYGNASPLLQSPLALFGINPLSGNPFKDVVAASGAEQFAQKNLPGGGIVFGQPQKMVMKDQKGNPIAVPAVSARGSWAMRQIWPAFGTLSRLSPPAGRSVLNSASGPVTGFTYSKFYDKKAMSGQLAYIQYHATRELIPDFEKRLKATNPDWRKGDPIPAGLRSAYNEISRLEKQAIVLKELLSR